MDEQRMIEAVRNHANANYHTGGWDILVECWDDGDILENIEDATTIEQAIKNVKKTIDLLAERRDEVRAEIF